MADNAQKKPLVSSLNRFAEQKATDAIQLLGRALPCSVVSVNGPIVTVKFEVNSVFTLPNVTVPQASSAWAREPTQVGDKGFVLPADAYLGGMSGLGGGTAGLVQQTNLSALVFQPVTNKAWVAVDPNAYTLIGPNGVVLRDTNANTTLTLTPDTVVVDAAGSITLQVGGQTLVLSRSGVAITGNLTVTGTIIGGSGGVDQVNLQSHRHNTSGGTGVGGAPVAGS